MLARMLIETWAPAQAKLYFAAQIVVRGNMEGLLNRRGNPFVG